MAALHHGARSAAMRKIKGKTGDLGSRSLLFVLGGDIGGLGERAGKIGAEQLGAELHRSVDLRLAEAALSRWGDPQPVEQNLGSTVEIILQVRMDSACGLADGQFASVI